MRPRKKRKASSGKTTQIASVPETSVQEGGNITRNSVSFTVPLTSARPSSSTADPPSLFATHHVPEDQAGAAKEAYTPGRAHDGAGEGDPGSQPSGV